MRPKFKCVQRCNHKIAFVPKKTVQSAVMSFFVMYISSWDCLVGSQFGKVHLRRCVAYFFRCWTACRFWKVNIAVWQLIRGQPAREEGFRVANLIPSPKKWGAVKGTPPKKKQWHHCLVARLCVSNHLQFQPPFPFFWVEQDVQFYEHIFVFRWAGSTEVFALRGAEARFESSSCWMALLMDQIMLTTWDV